jgi:hypothetical protein
MARELTRLERLDALQQQLHKAWDRVYRLEEQTTLARAAVGNLLRLKADLLREKN